MHEQLAVLIFHPKQVLNELKVEDCWLRRKLCCLDADYKKFKIKMHNA